MPASKRPGEIQLAKAVTQTGIGVALGSKIKEWKPSVRLPNGPWSRENKKVLGRSTMFNASVVKRLAVIWSTTALKKASLKKLSSKRTKRPPSFVRPLK